MQRVHRVEQVRNHASTLVSSRNGLLVSGIRVTNRVNDVALGEFGDLSHHITNFVGSSDHLDRTRVPHVVCAIAMKQVLEILSCTQHLSLVNAVSTRADERTLNVSSEGLCAVLRVVCGAGWA